MAGHQSSRAAKQQRSRAGKADSSITERQGSRPSRAAGQQGRQSFRTAKTRAAAQQSKDGSRAADQARQQRSKQGSRATDQSSRATEHTGHWGSRSAGQQSSKANALAKACSPRVFLGPIWCPENGPRFGGRSRVTKSTWIIFPVNRLLNM